MKLRRIARITYGILGIVYVLVRSFHWTVTLCFLLDALDPLNRT